MGRMSRLYVGLLGGAGGLGSAKKPKKRIRPTTRCPQGIRVLGKSNCMALDPPERPFLRIAKSWPSFYSFRQLLFHFCLKGAKRLSRFGQDAAERAASSSNLRLILATAPSLPRQTPRGPPWAWWRWVKKRFAALSP